MKWSSFLEHKKWWGKSGKHVASVSLPLGDGRLRGFHHRTRPVDQDHHEVHREEGQRGFQIDLKHLDL